MRTVTYQCPNCGAALEFNNAKGKFVCKYCDSEFSDDDIKQHFGSNEEINLEESAPDPELTEEQREIEEFTGASALYTCPNCGAGIICGKLDASVRCHFCHTPVILTGRLSGEFKPKLIIPFSTTREKAESGFYSYIKGKFLLPNGFKENARINSISALYVPYWLRCGEIGASFKAEGRRIRTWRAGNYIHTNTKIYNIVREADLTFLYVPCDGSKRISDELMESIEPFDYGGLKNFSMSYLSGCAAEKYDVAAAEAMTRIEERIKQAAVEVIRDDIKGYNSLSSENCIIRDENGECIYALLPVWFLNYTYKNKDYSFAMNGQTGTMFGTLPVSTVKSFIFGGSIFAVLTVILGLIGGVIFGG